jgi:DnaJ like chaperone protein
LPDNFQKQNFFRRNRFMSTWNKWIAGALGWALGGPIGGILGFALGAISEDAVKTYKPGKEPQPNDFSVALLVLCAAVMKADNKLMKTELEFIRQFFIRQFGPTITQQRMLLLREILKQPIPLADVCEQIRHNIDSSSRLQLLHLLFGIAAADGHVNPDEAATLKEISWRIGVSDRDYISLQSMFVRDANAAYKILEIEPSASEEEIKKAYRKMAMQHHPDKVHHLGPEYQKDALEMFKKINEAYDQIKKERGIA